MNERKLKIRDGKDDNVRVKVNRKKTANDLEKERKKYDEHCFLARQFERIPPNTSQV